MQGDQAGIFTTTTTSGEGSWIRAKAPGVDRIVGWADEPKAKAARDPDTGLVEKDRSSEDSDDGAGLTSAGERPMKEVQASIGSGPPAGTTTKAQEAKAVEAEKARDAPGRL